jgi:hypothetical protein
MFNLWEINQMGREMCNYSQWNSSKSKAPIAEAAIKKDFREQNLIPRPAQTMLN